MDLVWEAGYALNLFKTFFKKQLKGFIGIASAPEFLENLMWKKFSKKIKKIILAKKVYTTSNMENLHIL